VPESSAIIDYLDAFAGGARMVPEDAGEAVEARVWDRFFDGFVAVNVTKIVVDRLRPEGRGDPEGVEQARSTLRTAYGVLEERMQGREWAAGGAFGLADCAAAPSLFYAGACEPFHAYPALRGYYERLLGRPSFARAVEEARPFRPLFPLPWPDEYR
jgi:glutathione S-transferase